jgi:hypothetical protein
MSDCFGEKIFVIIYINVKQQVYLEQKTSKFTRNAVKNLNLVLLDFIQALFVYFHRSARVTRSFSVSGVQIQFKAIMFL